MLTAYLIAVVLAALALTRLPSAIRGRNVLIASSAAAIVVAFALITPDVYGTLDRLSPIPNLVDLIAKLGTVHRPVARRHAGGPRVERADHSATNLRPARRPRLPRVFLAEVVIFALVHTSSSAPDLVNNLGEPLVRLYSTLATAYPAYIATLLLPHVWKGRTSTQRATKATSMFLLVGLASRWSASYSGSSPWPCRRRTTSAKSSAAWPRSSSPSASPRRSSPHRSDARAAGRQYS